jgi:hypothetical protein
MADVTPFRFAEVPEGHPEEGLYAFGLDEERRRGLNFKRGLVSYSKLRKFVEPGQGPGKFVAGVGNLVSDRLLFGSDAIVGRYYFHKDQCHQRAVKGQTTAAEAAANKIWLAQWERDNPDKVFIRPKQLEEATRMIQAVLDNPETNAVIEARGIAECGIVANLDGLMYRSWIDKLCRQAIVDIKTSRCRDEEEFAETIVKYGYDVQGSLYVDQCEALGLGFLPYYWLVVSKSTNRAWLQQMDERFYDSGRRWRQTVGILYRQHGELKQQLEDTLADLAEKENENAE